MDCVIGNLSTQMKHFLQLKFLCYKLLSRALTLGFVACRVLKILNIQSSILSTYITLQAIMCHGVY